MPKKTQSSEAAPAKEAKTVQVTLYWDCQNVKISLERAEFLLNFAKNRGQLISSKAYSNWQHESKTHAKHLNNLGFERVNVPSSAKNSVDHKLYVDCIEEAFGNTSPDLFIIVSGDGDFASLVHVLKNKGKQVSIFAQPSGFSQELIDIADESRIIESVDEVPQIPRFRNPSLLTRALTHRSYNNEHPDAGEDNERLEFLGDAVLNFLSSKFLYNLYPDMSEAQLTRLRSALVDEPQLAAFAEYLQIGNKMRLGKGAIKDKGRKNDSLLSNTFEAIIGAYFLDSGLDAVWNFVEPLFASAAEGHLDPGADADPKILVDSKNLFQQWALANFGQNPAYATIGESGPDHAKEFIAEVRVGSTKYGIGQGRSKKEAEKRAAENALKKVGAV